MRSKGSRTAAKDQGQHGAVWGCLLPARNPSADGAETVLGASSATTMTAGRGGGGDAHNSERYLLSFSGSKLSRHLSHVNSEREETVEGLL